MPVHRPSWPVDTLNSRGFASDFRILEKDENNIDACQILAMHELVREGNVTTVSCLETQKSSLDRDKEESIIA